MQVYQVRHRGDFIFYTDRIIRLLVEEGAWGTPSQSTVLD